LNGAFRKISRVGSLLGGTKWYLSEDCLLSAKRVMYTVEYRRFYLHDLEYVAVWPSPSWRFRVIIPGVLFGLLGACLWLWVNSTSGAIFTGIGLAWVVLELALGPTAKSTIKTSGMAVDLPVVKRTRRAGKVLATIDAAVRTSRGVVERSAAPTTSTAEPHVPTLSEASVTASAAAATQTNAS